MGVFTHAELILSLMHSCKLPFSVASLSYPRKHNGTPNPTLKDLFASVAVDALSGIRDMATSPQKKITKQQLKLESR